MDTLHQNCAATIKVVLAKRTLPDVVSLTFPLDGRHSARASSCQAVTEDLVRRGFFSFLGSQTYLVRKAAVSK